MNLIKPTIKTEIIPVIFIILCIVLSFYFYSVFPDRVPTHWNIEGEVDGWSSKAVGAFLFPGIVLGMYLLFLLLPSIDPKKERYAQFGKVYHFFKTAMVLMLLVMYLSTSFYVLGFGPSPGEIIPVLIGILFIFIGNYLPKIKPNWFMGIRTPWTLSSEMVWQKTHRLGGRLFVLSGLIFILMPFISSAKFKIIGFVLAIVLMSLVSFIYSYWLYKKENNTKA